MGRTGQPLAMAVGLAVLNEVNRPEFLQHVCDVGLYLKSLLNGLDPALNLKDVRGKGLLVGVDLPSFDAPLVAKECMNKGLLINASGPHTIRFVPALIASKDDCDNAIRLLNEVLKSHVS